MTTISNFLHSTFLDSASISTHPNNPQQFQTPIWVINGNRAMNTHALRDYMIEHCVTQGKSLVRLDFGVGVLRVVRDWQERVVVGDGIELVTVGKDKLYYVLTVNAEARKNTSTCITSITKALNTIACLLKLPHQKSLCLLVQGLQALATEKQGNQNLQSFINHLSSLDPVFRQIAVFKCGSILLPEHEFALERISTCFTVIEGYGRAEEMWVVRSTVRRATGFSNEEVYVIKKQKNNRLKVQKYVATPQQQQSESHKKMVSDLGFMVKKADQTNKNQQIKQLIYPHLRMQTINKNNNNKDNNEGCDCEKNGCQGCEKCGQGLIVLDDQQEDDDDIDV